MIERLKGLYFIFPIMFYFTLEAFIVGVFISVLWKFFLANNFGHLGYLQIVVIYWIIKMLLFDVFKLIATHSQNKINENEVQKSDT